MAELKSSFNKGIEAENLVAQDLIQRKCKILKQRLQTPFAEVDLVAMNTKNQIVAIEVKTLSKWDWIHTRISKKQIQRLNRAALYLADCYKKEIILCSAFVINKKIYYMEIN